MEMIETQRWIENFRDCRSNHMCLSDLGAIFQEKYSKPSLKKLGVPFEEIGIQSSAGQHEAGTQLGSFPVKVLKPQSF